MEWIKEEETGFICMRDKCPKLLHITSMAVDYEPLTIRDELCYKMQEARQHMRNLRNCQPTDGVEYVACITALSGLKGYLRGLREAGKLLNRE